MGSMLSALLDRGAVLPGSQRAHSVSLANTAQQLAQPRLQYACSVLLDRIALEGLLFPAPLAMPTAHHRG